MKKFLNRYWPYVSIAVLSLTVAWPLLWSGYFSHQDDLHLIRIFEMRQCFLDLQIPCRWVSNMGWGNGFPLFNFYGVFIYYLGAVLSFVFGYIISSKIIFFLALSLGSFGIYLLVNKLWGKAAGLTSAVLYLLAPYKALDIYVRGALGEAVALAIIPFAFYFYLKLIQNPKNNRYFILSSVSFFLFLITHNIMTVIFTPVLFFWVTYLGWVYGFKSIKYLVFSFLLSLGLSSFFLLPAFFEKSLVQTESLTRFELDYRANFVSIKQLFLDRTWGYGTSIPGPEGGMSFQIGWPHWILSVISLFSIIIYKVDKKKKLLVFGINFVFWLSVLMTHNKSTPIWESFSILSYFQFPWRFLSLSIFTASILGGVVVSLVKGRWRLYFAGLIFLLALILNWHYFKPREFFKVSDSDYIYGELWDQQRRGAILDYLPKTALEPREAASESPIIISGEAEAGEFINRSNKWKFNIDVTQETVVEVPVFYFPNWKVWVNGEQYLFSYDNLQGRISVKLAPGKYKVIGKFINTPIRTFSNLITLASLIGLVGYIKWKK